MANEDESERIVHVDWGTTYELYPVRIRVTAYDRVGLLRDVTSAVSAEDVNIASVVTKEHPDGTVTMELTIYTKNLEQLGRLFAKLEGVRSIIEVTRDRSTIPLLTPN